MANLPAQGGLDPRFALGHQQQRRLEAGVQPGDAADDVVAAADKGQLLFREFYGVGEGQRPVETVTQVLRILPQVAADIGVEADIAPGAFYRLHCRECRAAARLGAESDGADVQPLAGGKRREILGLKEQVGARTDHKGKGALPVAIEIDHHRGGALRRIEAHIVHIHLLLRQGVTHKTAEGIVADLSIRENIILALQAKRGVFHFLSKKRQSEIAEEYIAQLGIKVANAEDPISQLSGGNQQKAMLARWIATDPKMLILDEPTRGVDIAAKLEIMDWVKVLCRKGLAIIFISSEMPEVLRVSDRIAVLRDRQKIGEISAKDADEQSVLRMIAGVES